MTAGIVGFLDALSTKVFWLATVLFVLVNGAAIAAFTLSRSRRLVDEWTPRLVAADVALLGAGLGIPLGAALAKMGINALATVFGAPPLVEQ